MGLYLLKFTACLLIFLTFYKLVLEKENMHVFKRFYLLASLVLSISIPLISFTQYIEPTPLTFNEVQQDFLIANDPNGVDATINYIPYIISSIYIIGVLIFGFKFFRNLYSLNYKIKHNPKQHYYKFTHVLLKDLIVPHTFFNYIFFNKSKFEANEIPEEVFWHEQTHASQKHSIDVVFIEGLQVLLWFNPLIYIIKHAIKLNHEFLADQGVLQKGINTNSYQKIILAFSSNATEPQLANAINYSLIKKRFTVMKTQTTKRGVWLRSLILLPLLAIMLYGFSDTKIVEKTIEETSNENYTARSIDIEVFDNGTYEIDGIKANKKTFSTVISQLHQDITPAIRNRTINVHVNNGKAVSDEEIWFIYNSVIDYGFHRIVTYNQEIIREKGNKPFAIINTDTQEQSNTILKKSEQQKATKAQIKEYNKLAKHFNSYPENEIIVKEKDVKRIKHLYSIMSTAQKKDAEPFPNIPPPPPPAPKAPEATDAKESLPPPPPPIPTDATPEQRKKYEKAIKMYKEKAAKVKSMLPPPPPPPIPNNATPEQKKKYEENIKKYKLAVAKSKQNMVRVREVNNVERTELIRVKEQYAAERKASQELKLARVAEMKVRQEKLQQEKLQRVAEREVISKERKEQLAKVKLREVKERQVEKERRQLKLKEEKLKHVEERQALGEQKREIAMARKLNDQKERVLVREIKTPKPPKSPLDHIVEMAKKDAVFYYEGKKISSDKAIEIIKTNNKINISTNRKDSSKPKVYLSTKPMVVEIKEKN